MAKRILYLVRHGHYEGSRRDDGELSANGIRQAQLTGALLSALPFSAVYFSPMRRAAQTAEIIAGYLPAARLHEDEELRECIPSIPPRYISFFADRFPDLDTDKVSACADRLNAAYTRYFQPPPLGDNVYELLVCHGNVMRYLVTRVLDVSAHAWTSMLVNHCGISRVMIDSDGSLFLAAHNDTGHLPQDLLSEN